MKINMTFLGTLTISLTVFSHFAFANPVNCPSAVNTVRQVYGVSDIAGQESSAPNGQGMVTFQNMEKGIVVEASADLDGGSSWIIAKTSYQNQKYQELELLYQNCKLSSIIYNQMEKAEKKDQIVGQVSAGLQFCKNLNSGKQPKVLDGKYLEFDDQSGNISASEIEGVRAMCKNATPFFN